MEGSSAIKKVYKYACVSIHAYTHKASADKVITPSQLTATKPAARMSSYSQTLTRQHRRTYE